MGAGGCFNLVRNMVQGPAALRDAHEQLEMLQAELGAVKDYARASAGECEAAKAQLVQRQGEALQSQEVLRLLEVGSL